MFSFTQYYTCASPCLTTFSSILLLLFSHLFLVILVEELIFFQVNSLKSFPVIPSCHSFLFLFLILCLSKSNLKHVYLWFILSQQPISFSKEESLPYLYLTIPRSIRSGCSIHFLSKLLLIFHLNRPLLGQLRVDFSQAG